MNLASVLPWRPAPVAAPAVGGGAVLAISLPSPAALFRARRHEAREAGEPSFSDTVLAHLDAAYSLARYLTRDEEAAEDIVQDAVLKAHRAFAGYRGGGAKAWLLTIVRREYIDWTNARRAARTVFTEVEDAAGVEADAPSGDETPEDLLLRQGDVGAVRRAVEALPEPFREAIVLRELEELSYREVAEITGVPMGTVMSRLARGRELLAGRLRSAPAASPGQEAAR